MGLESVNTPISVFFWCQDLGSLHILHWQGLSNKGRGLRYHCWVAQPYFVFAKTTVLLLQTIRDPDA